MLTSIDDDFPFTFPAEYFPSLPSVGLSNNILVLSTIIF